MNNKPKIEELLKQRILLLDGGMGTMIQGFGLKEEDFRCPELSDHSGQLKGMNDLLSVTRPDVIERIHSEYLSSGADIIETNTFSSNAVALEDYGLSGWAYRLNVEGAQCARRAADEFTRTTPDKPRFVAGSIGPTSKTCSMSPDVNDPGYRAVDFETLRAAYATQVKGLMDGGVDLILIETIFDTLNAKAALFAAQEVFEQEGRSLPLMVSATITDASGRMLSGQTVEAFLISVSHAPLLSIGLNCALGAHEMMPYLQILRAKTDLFISAHPNAGLPNAFGGYDQTAEEFAREVRTYFEEGLVNIIGGCCGTTPAFIRAVARQLEEFASQKKTSNK